MDYTRLGPSGLTVSRLCLGCMSYGDPGKGQHGWVLDEEASRPFIRKALEAGINFFDTANAYSNGGSEEVVGRALRDFARRDEIVVATKAFFKWRGAPNTGGNSRKALFQAVDDSLARLGMDYIDLLQLHRWDADTPIEETMAALHDIIRSGRVRYIGMSSCHAWQFAKAQEVARTNGWTRFISMQNHYNLLYREEEREMIPLCQDQGIGLIPWSPLARGKVARPWESEATKRSDTDPILARLYAGSEESDREVVNAVEAVAKAHGVSMATVGLAWHFAKGVAAPIVGATKERHLDDAVAAVDLVLSEDEVSALEAHYVPKPVAGIDVPRSDVGKVSVLG